MVGLVVELAEQGIPTMLEASRRGGHLWVHFTEPTPAHVVRAWLLPYALALGVEDIYKKCEELKQSGVKVVREPGPMAHGTTVIAFIEDPDGYKIELIDRL